MQVHSFLHRNTETYTHVLADVTQQLCAVIDPVLDFDPKSGHTSTADNGRRYLKVTINVLGR